MSQWAHYSEADPEFAQAVAKNPIYNVQDILTRRAEIVKLLKARLETADYPSKLWSDSPLYQHRDLETACRDRPCRHREVDTCRGRGVSYQDLRTGVKRPC